MRIGRRAGLLGAAAAALGGCGFHPLYGTAFRATPAAAQLASIYVAVMPERSGQLLRQALQRRFDGPGASVPRLYDLTGGLGVSGEGVAIARDNTSSRIRYIGSATFYLRKLDPQHTTVLTGTVKALDGVNIFVSEYFAQDLETETVQRRLAEACADQITLQIATFLDQQATPKT